MYTYYMYVILQKSLFRPHVLESHRATARRTSARPPTRSVPQKRGRSEARKTPFILYVPIAKTHFGEIVGGGTARPTPAISPKTASERSEKNAIYFVGSYWEDTFL